MKEPLLFGLKPPFPTRWTPETRREHLVAAMKRDWIRVTNIRDLWVFETWRLFGGRRTWERIQGFLSSLNVHPEATLELHDIEGRVSQTVTVRDIRRMVA